MKSSIYKQKKPEKLLYEKLEKKGEELIGAELSVRVKNLWEIEKYLKELSSLSFVKRLINSSYKARKEITEKYAIDIHALSNFTAKIGELLLQYYQKSIKRSVLLHDIGHVPFGHTLENKIDSVFESFTSNGHLVNITRREKYSEYKKGRIYCAIAKPNEKFIVSKGFLDNFLFYFDFWLNTTEDRKWIADQYAKKIKEIENDTKKEITHLCFVKKEFGCNGPIELFWDIGGRFLNKECFTYRQNALPSQRMFLGDVPSKKSIVCILYDLRRTGEGITDATEKIENEHECKVIGAVVLYDFLGKTLDKNFLVKPILPEGVVKIKKFKQTSIEKLEKSDNLLYNLDKIQKLDEEWIRKADLSNYAGEWVAVFNQKIMAHSPDVDVSRKTAVRELAVPIDAILLKHIEKPGLEYI